jgi:hypothetical protein
VGVVRANHSKGLDAKVLCDLILINSSTANNTKYPPINSTSNLTTTTTTTAHRQPAPHSPSLFINKRIMESFIGLIYWCPVTHRRKEVALRSVHVDARVVDLCASVQLTQRCVCPPSA